jgi:hypothetical protein
MTPLFYHINQPMARIFDNAHDFRFNDLIVNGHPANALESQFIYLIVLYNSV